MLNPKHFSLFLVRQGSEISFHLIVQLVDFCRTVIIADLKRRALLLH